MEGDEDFPAQEEQDAKNAAAWKKKT